MEKLIRFGMFSLVAFGLLAILIDLANKPPKE